MISKCRYLTVIFITVGFLIGGGVVILAQMQEEHSSRQEILKRSTEHFQKGEKFYQQGDYLHANEEFKKAQELLDGIRPEELTIEEAAMEPEESSGSIKDKEAQAKELNYDELLRRALAYSKSRESQKAIWHYLRAISLKPDNADLHYNLAIEYLKTKQFNQAAEELQKVIQLNPKDKDAYYNLGLLYESYLRDLMQAKFYYTQYVKLAKGEADVDEVKVIIRQIDKQIRLEERSSYKK